MKHFFAEEREACSSLHEPFVCFNFIDGPFYRPLGTNCQLHPITRMVSQSLPLLIRFILSSGNPFLSCHNVWLGVRSASSFLIHKRKRFALCQECGRVSPCLILFWLLPMGTLCYVGTTCNTLCSSSGPSQLILRRIADMVHQVAAHHLKRLACLYVRQSTLQQVFENTESTARQ